MNDSSRHATVQQDAVPEPASREIIAAVVRMIEFSTERLQHIGRVAWQVARNVGPTLATDQQTVRNERDPNDPQMNSVGVDPTGGLPTATLFS